MNEILVHFKQMYLRWQTGANLLAKPRETLDKPTLGDKLVNNCKFPGFSLFLPA